MCGTSVSVTQRLSGTRILLVSLALALVFSFEGSQADIIGDIINPNPNQL